VNLTAGCRERIQPGRSDFLRVSYPDDVGHKTNWPSANSAQLQAVPGMCPQHLPRRIQCRRRRRSRLEHHLTSANHVPPPFLTLFHPFVTSLNSERERLYINCVTLQFGFFISCVPRHSYHVKRTS